MHFVMHTDQFISYNNYYLLHCCIIDVNECTESQADCINEAVCVNIIGNYTCNCPGGYTGDGRLRGSGCVGEKL